MPIKRKLLIAKIINVSLNKQRKENKKRDRSLVLCKTVWQIYLKKMMMPWNQESKNKKMKLKINRPRENSFKK